LVDIQIVRSHANVYITDEDIHNPLSTPDAHYGRSIAFNNHRIAVGSKSDSVLYWIIEEGTDPHKAFGLQQIVSVNGAPEHDFGWAVAMDGLLLAISAPSASKVYIYCLTDDEPELLSVIFDAADANTSHAFGYSISISHDVKNDYILAVGEPFNEEGGSVYIYESKDVGITWQLEGVLDNPSADNITRVCDNFGYSVSIAPDTVVVGAPGTKKSGYLSYGSNMLTGVNCGIGSGSVYIYEEMINATGGYWIKEAQLFSNLPVSTDWASGFGYSIDMREVDANLVLVIGAPQIGLGNFQYETTWAEGSVYIYQEEGTVFNFKGSITSAEKNNYDQFGYSVGISAFSSSNTPNLKPVLAVGTTNYYVYLSNPNGAKIPGCGAVYIYTQNSQDFTFYKQFETPLNIQHTGMQFGAAIAVDTGGPMETGGAYHVVVGAPGQHIEDTVIILDAGSAYVIDISETAQQQSGDKISGASVVIAIIIIIIIVVVIIIIVTMIVRRAKQGNQAMHVAMVEPTSGAANPYTAN